MQGINALPEDQGSAKKLSAILLVHMKRKIVVFRAVSRFPVIARPVRTLVVAIPRLEVKCSTIALQSRIMSDFGGNRYLVPFNRGIATEAGALARNDSISLQTTIQVIGFTKLHSKLLFADLFWKCLNNTNSTICLLKPIT